MFSWILRNSQEKQKDTKCLIQLFSFFFNSQIYTKLYLSKTGISSREKYHFLILYNVLAAPKIKIINQMIYCKNYERMVIRF